MAQVRQAHSGDCRHPLCSPGAGDLCQQALLHVLWCCIHRGEQPSCVEGLPAYGFSTGILIITPTALTHSLSSLTSSLPCLLPLHPACFSAPFLLSGARGQPRRPLCAPLHPPGGARRAAGYGPPRWAHAELNQHRGKCASGPHAGVSATVGFGTAGFSAVSAVLSG